MGSKEAARQLRQQRAHQGSHRTRSIVSDNETFRTVVACAAFALAIYAVLKCWGVW